MTSFNLDIALRCQRALDIAASQRLRPLPAVSREFGHDTETLDRAAYEHAVFLVAIRKRRNAS